MFLPNRRNALTLTTVCGAAIGFLQYFKINGLDELTISPRTGSAVVTGNQDGLLGSGWNTQQPFDVASGFPSTSGAISDPPSSGYFPGNPHTAAPPVPQSGNSNGLILQQDRWASNPSSSPQASVNRTGLPVAAFAPVAPSYGQEQTKIRLGSFNSNFLDLAKLSDPLIADRLVQLIGEFSCIALQEVSGDNREVLPTLIRLLNQHGAQYEYVVGPKSTGTGRTECLAFVFDTHKVEVDRYQTYTLNDPNDVLTIEPLVGWFRAKQVSVDEAITFTFVNLKLTASAAVQEVEHLPSILQSIHDDGRNEDDIILAGEIGSTTEQLNAILGGSFKVLPNNGNQDFSVQAGNSRILLPPLSQDEFSGSSGTIQIYRRYNLTPQQAAAISVHSPVWADFYTIEGVAQ